MTVSEIFDQTPEQRRDFMREMGEPTHRGKPRSPEMDGYHESTKAKRAPTHRRNVPAVMPARIHSILHLIGGRDA